MHNCNNATHVLVCTDALLPQDAIDTAGDKQRRRRAAKPDLPPFVPGLCLPKALAPLLPIYLQGILQVGVLSNTQTKTHTNQLVVLYIHTCQHAPTSA